MSIGSGWPRSADFAHEERSPARGTHEVPLDKYWGSPQRMCVVEVTSFDEGAQAVADQFKRRQPVLLNPQRADENLGERMVDFRFTQHPKGSLRPARQEARRTLKTAPRVLIAVKLRAKENQGQENG